MRVLMIEDDQKIQSFVSKGLQQEGHFVDIASTGKSGLEIWQQQQYDAVILDLMLPGMSGIKILTQMRNKGDDTPVIILSAKATVDDRVLGLDAGADDYLIKPFSFAELSARLQAMIRRSQREQQRDKSATILTGDDVKMDLLRRVVTRDNRKIELQPREFALLEFMMRNPNRPLSKTMILERVWEYNFDPQTNIVDVLVCRLRNKIDAGHENRMIQTMRGVGYVFRTQT